MPSMAVRIEADNKKVVYSADTGYCADIANLAKNADLLIHECSVRLPDTRKHSTPSQAGEIAAKANCNELWLTHISKHSPDEYVSIINEAKNAFDRQIRIVPDFEWLII